LLRLASGWPPPSTAPGTPSPSFGSSYSWHLAGSGSHGSLGDLKIVPGRAVMLTADAVSSETVS